MKKEIENLKLVLWKERWSFIRLVIFVYAFLGGATLEHYFPNAISWVW